MLTSDSHCTKAYWWLTIRLDSKFIVSRQTPASSERQGRTAMGCCSSQVPCVPVNYPLKPAVRYAVITSQCLLAVTLQQFRVLSRVCTVPFKKPIVTPETAEQQDAFNQLDYILGEETPFSGVGWAIKQQSVLGSKKRLEQWNDSCGVPCWDVLWALMTICIK